MGEKIFLVLVPHRDTRGILRKYGIELYKTLLKTGGGYHFPWVAPLAELSCPLNEEERKSAAKTLREAAGNKFTAAEACTIPFPAETSGTVLFGLKLDLYGKDFTQRRIGAEGKILPSLVIGTSLLPADTDISDLPPPPEVSFGAAAVANMYWQPICDDTGGDIGCKWRIGKLTWLLKNN